MKGWLKGVLKQDKHDDSDDHPPAAAASTAPSPSSAPPGASQPLASTAASSPAAASSAPPNKDTLHPISPLASPPAPVTSALFAQSPSAHVSPVLSPAGASSSSPHAATDAANQSNFPALLAHCQKLIQTFLSKHRSHPTGQPSTLQSELLASLKQLTSNATFDATKLGVDGPKLVAKLSELCAKCVKDLGGSGHGEVARSTSALYEAMTAPHPEMHDMDGFGAVKALFYLFTGPSTTKAQPSSSSSASTRIVPPPFSSGHNSAIKAHLPTTLIDVILANANVQVTVSGQTLTSIAGTTVKKLTSLSTALQSATGSLHPPSAAKSGSSLSAPKASSTLSDCEYHSFTLLAILCSHDHTAIEDLISHHKLDTLLLLSSVQGPSAFALSPITAVFHSNLLKLLKCVSKGQKLVKGVSKALHDTAVIQQLLEVLRRGPETDTPADLPAQPVTTSFQLAYDCFDLLTSFLIDSFPYSSAVLDEFEAHDGYAAILAFLQRYCRRLDRVHQPKMVARRLAALVSVGYVKLEIEQDVLPFNLPPSSRTSAAHNLLPPVPAALSPSAKIHLSSALSINPSLPDTHSHAIGQLAPTPSIARMRGHARISSSTFSVDNLSILASTAASSAASSAASTQPAGRSAPSAATIRNLEAVQLIRDVFLQCSSSSLRLQILQSLEFVFTSAAQLHIVSSTGLTSRLLQSLPSFSTPVQNALLHSLQLIISHCHNDYIPFKELCALNVTLTAELSTSSLSSLQSVLVSLDSLLEYDQLRYQHLLREAGVLDVMVTNVTQWYALFAVAFEQRYDPQSASHAVERDSTGALRRASAFSPRAEALSTIRLEVRKRREMGTPSGSPASEVRRRLDVDDRRESDSPQPSPAAASSSLGNHSRNASLSIFPLPTIPDNSTPHQSTASDASSSALSVTHLVRVVTAGLDVLTVLLRDSSTNQELFSTTTGPAVLLSFTVYPPTSTKALHLVEMLLQAHYTRLEAMLAPPASAKRDRKPESDRETESVSLNRSGSIEGIMTGSGSTAPKTVQAMQLLGDAYMLALLHLLFSSLPAIAFELPFYRAPPSDPALLLKPANLSLATHPKLRTFFPLPTSTSAIDTNSILRIGRLLHLIRRALSSSYYGQQSFGRMRGFERVAGLLRGLSVKQIQITRGELMPLSRQQSGSTGDGSSERVAGNGSGAAMLSNVPPSTSPSPPSTSHSAVLFLVQEVMLTFILALKGNERNSAYPYPRPLPSHYHLSDLRHTIGFHTVGYRRLIRYLLKSGVVCGEDGSSWSVCADLVCNWLFWLALEYLPSDHELISTPSLPCTLNTQQLEQQLSAEMKEEQDMINIALNEQTLNSPPATSPPFTPPTAIVQQPPAVPVLRVNTDDQSASTWPCWWEEQEATIEFTAVPVHKLVLQSPGTVYHPLALRLVARFLTYSSHHLQRRLLVLITLLAKNNAINAIALGQADLLAPLIAFFRPVLNQPLDVRHQLVLDVVQLLLPFTPGAGSMHALFGLFDQPQRFPTSLLVWLADMATRSVPMPYVQLDGKEAGMRVASINNAKWPPSNGYTVAAWVFMEPGGGAGGTAAMPRNSSSGDLAGRRNSALPNLPPTHHRHHLSVQVGKTNEGESPNQSPVRHPVRKMSAQLPSHPLPPTAPSKPATQAAPPSPSMPPSPSPGSAQPPMSLHPISLLQIESDDGKSVFSLIFHPVSGQLTLRTAGRSSYAFPGVKLQPGRWHHIAITHSSSFIQGSWCHLFINGVHQLETKVSYINKGGSAANISAYMGGAATGPSSQSIDLSAAGVTGVTAGVDGGRHVSRPSAGSLQVPGERSRSNSFSVSATTKESDSPPSTPNPNLSSLATSSSTAASTSSSTASSSVSRWRLASCLLLDDVLPDVVVRSLYELGPRTSAIVHAASRPTVVDTLASVYPASRSLSHALDNIPALVPKVSRRAQWSVVSPMEESTALAMSRRTVGTLLELDPTCRTRLAASPTESAGKSITSVVAFERILFFFHAANGQDVASAVHTTSINPMQMDFRIDNSGPPAITSDARLTAPATVVQPRAVVDRLKQIGGMRRLLALVDKCGARVGRDDSGPDAPGMALRQVLLLISQALRRHPSNHRDMQDIDGYKLLGHLLKQISARARQSAQPPPPTQSVRRASISSPFPVRTPSPVPYTSTSFEPPVRDISSSSTSPLLHPASSSQQPTAIAVVTSVLDCVAVEIVFSLVGLSDSGAAGVITNSAALDYLILDFHIWRECQVEVQLYLFQCLFNCICTSAARDENIAALRESRVVGWLVSLASDVGLHTDVLNCCISIIRELMLHQLIEHELHIVADFAATSIMTDSRPEVIQQPIASRRSPYMRQRRDSMEVSGVTVLSSDDSFPHELPHTPSSQSRRSLDDSVGGGQPAGSPPVAVSDSSFKVHIGSKASARVNSLFIEMLLDVLLKIRSNPKQLATFFKRIDFSWLYCVLHSGDPQATNQAQAQQPNRHQRRGSLGRASVLHHKQGLAGSGEVQSAAILSLKILMVLLQDSHLFSKFRSSPGFSSLPPLLLPHCHHGQVFSILLCAMLGKSVLDVPTAALDINAIGSVEAWSSLLNSAASAEGEGGVVVPELVPVVIALLRECIELTKHHQANAAATAAANTAVASSAQSVLHSTAVDISRPMSPVHSSVVLDQLESFSNRSSSSSTTANDVGQMESVEDEGVIVDLSGDQSLELSEAPRRSPNSATARHQRTLTTLEVAAQPRPPAVSVDVPSPAVSLSLPTPTQRSPSRRATFNAHESGNVAATVQAKRKKGHGRSGSLHMYELFSPSNELLKAAGGADSSVTDLKEPKSPLSARLGDLLGTKSDDAEGNQSTGETAAATVANGGGIESSPARRAARHRTMLTISTTGPLNLSAENTPASRGRQLSTEAKESTTVASAEIDEPSSAQLVILHSDEAGADSNGSTGENLLASRPITPSLPSRPLTPGSPLTPEAIHTTTGLKALRTIKNKDAFHNIAHYGHQRAHHQHHHHHSLSSSSSSVSSAYAHHYHAHIVHQPDIKAMNGTITFMTRLFNISDTFRTLACKQAFMRQLISAVFASATMGILQPLTLAAQQQTPQPQQRRAAGADGIPPIVHHTSLPHIPSLATLEAEALTERARSAGTPVVNDDPSVPTAPAIDLNIYSPSASEPGSPLSMGRQYSQELDASPSPSASSTQSRRRHLGDRTLSIDAPNVMPRVRKASSVIVTSAHQPLPLTAAEQPIRGIQANIDTAEFFRHSTSVLLFQLLRQIVVQNLLQRTKGTQMLIDCLDQAPAHSNLQQRIRYQTTLLAGLSARLEERLSGMVILTNSKLAYTVDRLGQLFVERLEQGMFLNGGPSTFQFLLHILLMPECRQIVDDTLQTDKDKATARASTAGMRVIRPLYDILNQVVLYLHAGWGHGEVTAPDVVQLNETLLQHASLLLGEHNSSRTLVACLCHHLYKQMSSSDDEVSGSAIRLWSWLMKNKLETMMELLRASITEQVKTMSRATSSTQMTGVDAIGPLSPPPVLDTSASEFAPPSNPASPTSSSRPAFVPPPISRKRLVDLLDDDGRGGFDQLMQAATGSHSDTGEPHWMTEFRHWLRSNDKRIEAVFAVTLQPQWSSYLTAQKREQSNSWNKQQAHVIQDMGRHRQEEADRLKKAAQMELTILNKLQTTSNVEIQRLLRRDQRLSEIDKQADRAWSKVREAMTAAQLMFDQVEHRLPPTQERLKRMREDVAGKRSWQLMMEHGEAVYEDEWRMTGDDSSIYVDEWEADIGGDRSAPPSAGSDLTLVFRQPWRVEPSEGPARVRRRLCPLQAMRPDAPLFSHPYRLWEEERRGSIVEEREKVVEGAEVASEGAETDVDASHEQETIEMDVTVDTRDGDGQDADYSDELKLGDLPTVSEQSTARDGESEAEPFESAASPGDESRVRRTSITINANGDIVDMATTSQSSSSSPRPLTRSPLRIDTRRGGSLTLSHPAVPEASSPSPSPCSGSARQHSLDANTSPALQRLRSSSLSASPRSGPRSAHRGLSLTGTGSDFIPAVTAEPRRRREKHGHLEGEEDSPRTPQSILRQLPTTGTGTGSEAAAADNSAPVTSGGPLPSSTLLMPTMSAPVYSASASAALDTSSLDISIVAPSETDSESKPGTPPPQSLSEFTSPELSARRTVGRPRSFTAEDAAPQSLAPPAGPPTLQMSHSAETLRADTAGNSPQPMTPSVPLPGSQDDEEGAEADDLLFLEEDKLKLLMNGDDIHYHWNCVRVYGMEEIRGILCLCERSIFVVDDYEISPDGDIVKLLFDANSDQPSTAAAHAAMADRTSSSAGSTVK